MRLALLFVAMALVTRPCLAAAASAESASPWSQWRSGPPKDPGYFPIAVWLQDPRNAAKYKAAGINLYVGLWKGPTAGQLKALAEAGMPVICDQNETGLADSSGVVIGWMHGDEPDNAQSLPDGKGYGPPIAAEKIIADYEKLRKTDPTRPVLLNLGQGVAWDGWYGRGVRTNHPEDYPEYVKGADAVSFDIYPVVHDREAVKGKLWYVARGVSRLVGWTNGAKPVWSCIECTRISSDVKATPRQVRAEVWMAIIHGARGLVYFVHEWKPRFNEHALLDDAEMLKAVTEVNATVKELAPVINSPTVAGPGVVPTDGPKSAVAAMVKKHSGATYVFAVRMTPGNSKEAIPVPGLRAGAKAEVLGEARSVTAKAGAIEDDFAEADVHIYRVQ